MSLAVNPNWSKTGEAGRSGMREDRADPWYQSWSKSTRLAPRNGAFQFLSRHCIASKPSLFDVPRLPLESNLELNAIHPHRGSRGKE
jgi:hypothetical protein